MWRPFWPFAALLVLGTSAGEARAQTADGAALFDRHCAACHVGSDLGRAPDRTGLAERTPESILDSLVIGAMAVQGAALSDAERRTLAEHLTGRKLGTDPRPTGQRCAAGSAPVDLSTGAQWNGWGAGLTNTRFQSGDQARVPTERVPNLKLKWAFGFPGASSARAQPAVAGGRLFVGSESGVVYALDARTGCTYWSYTAKAGVRTGMVLGPRAGAGGSKSSAVYFGDVRANVYALDAASGELLWTRKIDDHQFARITGTPAFDGEFLYVPVNAVGEEGAGSTDRYGCCTFRGSVVSLNAATGAVRWKTYTIDEAPSPRGKTPLGQVAMGPSGAGIWSAPTLDLKRRMLYVGTGNMFSGPDKGTGDAVIAMNLDYGTVKWVRQGTGGDISVGGCRDLNRAKRRPNCPAHEVGPDVDFGSSPMLVTLPDGRDLVVAGQKSGVTWAFDPDNEGAVKWQYKAGRGGPMGGTEWGTATDGEYAYIPISDDQSAIYERPGDTPGGLHAVKLATGERAWFAPPPPPRCGSGRGCSAAQSAAITAIPGVVFSGSIDGVLRAFSARDGSIVWEFDTNREFQTVNGVTARGASIGGPGPVVVDGMLYVNSGYSLGGRPGNVLLAFELP